MYSSKDLFLYAEKSSELRTLFAINSAMQAELSRRLQRWECAYEDCAPISSGPGLTILDLFLGAVLMTEFDRCEEYYNLLPHSAMELLNKACAYGSYQALNCRIEMNIGLLDNVLTDENEEQVDQFMHIAKLITNDANRLGNLYRSLAQIDAANALLNVAIYANQLKQMEIITEKFNTEAYVQPQSDYMTNNIIPIMKNSAISSGMQLNEIANQLKKQPNYPNKPLYLDFLELAIQSFCAARMLANNTASERIAHAIYPKAGLFGGPGKFFGDWDVSRQAIIEDLTHIFHIVPAEKYFAYLNQVAAITITLQGHTIDLSAPTIQNVVNTK